LFDTLKFNYYYYDSNGFVIEYTTFCWSCLIYIPVPVILMERMMSKYEHGTDYSTPHRSGQFAIVLFAAARTLLRRQYGHIPM
jgi:hypothetical protein